ncbi:hypothetical protein [Bacillus sp. FJAT-27251]|uniref:hypothetical protein n=1 Tax=Bacillus sp. FJAT-27251 TaxID=1684142 RepID=UPI0006A76F44|nr:hypothetical protein [Bacillus sp. FJAT-27251]
MKKLAGFLFIILLCYSVYHDFNQGSLPAAGKSQKTETIAPKQDSLPYFKKDIGPGDTVLSVLEDKLKGPLPVPISKAVQDFRNLNNGMEPEAIQIGKAYKFPDYPVED